MTWKSHILRTLFDSHIFFIRIFRWPTLTALCVCVHNKMLCFYIQIERENRKDIIVYFVCKSNKDWMWEMKSIHQNNQRMEKVSAELSWMKTVHTRIWCRCQWVSRTISVRYTGSVRRNWACNSYLIAFHLEDFCADLAYTHLNICRLDRRAVESHQRYSHDEWRWKFFFLLILSLDIRK